ncbi:reverse transcriptase domain-containing protein, partial [Tanacetum coccineum]
YLHLIKDCNYYETQYANDSNGVGYPQRKPIWDNASRVTQSNHFVPQAVPLRSSKVSISAARPNQVSTGRPKPVSTGRPKPVPTDKPKVPEPVPTGRQNRHIPVPTGRVDSPSITFDRQLLLSPQQVVLGKHIEKVYTGKILIQMLKIHTDDNVADLLTKAFNGPRVINSPCYHNKELASLEQTAIGKDMQNPFMVVMICQKSLGYSNSPLIHILRVGLVTNSPGSTHVAEVVLKSVAGSRFPAASSTRFMCSSQDSSRLDVAVKFIFQSSRYIGPTGRVVVPEKSPIRVDNEAITFNLDQTTRYSSTNDKSVNRIDIIDAVCEEYAPELLGFPNNDSLGGNPTPTSEPLTSEFILEEIEAYLKDDSISPEIDHADCDPEGDICLIEKLLNDDPFQLPPMTEAKSSIEEPPELELKDLPSHLEYAYLEENDKLPVIIAKGLKYDQKEALLKDYLTKFDPKSTEGVFLGYSPNSKAYIILNKETMRIEESLNVRFDERPPPKSSPLVDDDTIESQIIENQIEDKEIKEDEPLNKEIVNIKESKDHPIDSVIARLEYVRILLAYACAHDFKLFQMDVKSAFLNGFINEEVYVAQPLGFVNFEKPNHVLKLKKALYGLKQAPKACPRPAYPLYQPLSPPTDYQTVPPSSLNVSSPLSPITSPRISPSKLLTTPKLAPPLLTSPPPAPTQSSKNSSPLAINLDPVELIFSTPPTSPHTLFDSLKDLPPKTNNPPLPRPSFESIERLVNQPPPLPAMEPLLLPFTPQLPPLPPQLPPLGPNNPFPMLTHEMFCNHWQRTQVIVDNLHDEMRFILNHILDHLYVLAHNY